MISAFIGITFVAGFISWIFVCLQTDVKEREELLQLHGRHWKCRGQALGLNVISP